MPDRARASSAAWLEHLRPRLAPLALTPAREQEIVEELSQHLVVSLRGLRAKASTSAKGGGSRSRRRDNDTWRAT